MRRFSVALLATALGAGTLSIARDAHALGPIGLEIGAKAGAGSNPYSNGNDPNPLGFGIGARGGVTFLGLYGGLNFMYYLGQSKNETTDGSSFSESVHSTQYGIEAGYGLTLLSLLTLRAQLGVGNFTVTSSGGGQVAGVSASASQSQSTLYLEPGVTAMVSLGIWFIGADVNALILTGLKDDDGSGNSSTKSALTFHGQLGLTF
jgi:hypothetical protein